jgi:O-methyltransferase
LYSNKIVGDYFEFGCHTARTFRFALKESIVRQMKMDFYAFDSFEGLPDHKNNKKQNSWHMPGLLSTSETQFKKLVSKFYKHRRIHTIKGFYEKTLNNNLKKKLKKNKVKVSIINIDCDLEKSVSKSLDFALKFIVNGTILNIDDYYTTYKGDPRKGIPKIVKSLLKKNKIIHENWYQSGSCGRSILLYR